MEEKPLKFITHGSSKRAKRSDQVAEASWDSIKDVLFQKYIKEDLSMRELVIYMKENFGLSATGRQYKTQFDKWEWPKKRTKSTKNIPDLPAATTKSAIPVATLAVPNILPTNSHDKQPVPTELCAFDIDISGTEHLDNKALNMVQQSQDIERSLPSTATPRRNLPDHLWRSDAAIETRCGRELLSGEVEVQLPEEGHENLQLKCLPDKTALSMPQVPKTAGTAVEDGLRASARKSLSVSSSTTAFSYCSDLSSASGKSPDDRSRDGRYLDLDVEDILLKYRDGADKLINLLRRLVFDGDGARAPSHSGRVGQHTGRSRSDTTPLVPAIAFPSSTDPRPQIARDSEVRVKSTRASDIASSVIFKHSKEDYPRMHDQIGPRSSIVEVHGQGLRGRSPWPGLLQTVSSSVNTTSVRQETVSRLFGHRHGLSSRPGVEWACCWPKAAEKILEGTCVESSIVFETDQFGKTSACCFTPATLAIVSPKATSILETAIDIAQFKINVMTVKATEITKMIQLADFCLSVRLFDDCFLWSLITLKLLRRSFESGLRPLLHDPSGLPFWFSIFLNMLKSSTSPEHLQLVATSLRDIELLGSVTCGLQQAQVDLIYVYLGATIRQFSDTDSGHLASHGCWAMLTPSFTKTLLARKIILCTKHLTENMMLTSLELDINAMQGESCELIDWLGLVRRVGVILKWCAGKLFDQACFSFLMEIDKKFWDTRIPNPDVARFEQLAVYTYLCQALWKLQVDQLSPQLKEERRTIASALQDIATPNGLSHEEVLRLVLEFKVECESSYPRILNKSTLQNRYQTLMTREHDLADLRVIWEKLESASREPLRFENVEYNKAVGIFLRGSASRELGLSGSQSLIPVRHHFDYGERFIATTMLSPSLRSSATSQMSVDTRMFRATADKIKRNSLNPMTNSWTSAKISSSDFTGMIDLRVTDRDSSGTNSSDRMSFSMASLRGSLRDSGPPSQIHEEMNIETDFAWGSLPQRADPPIVRGPLSASALWFSLGGSTSYYS